MARKLTKKRTQVQKIVKRKRQERTTSGAAASSTVTMPTGKYTEGVGRRKVATARVRVYDKAGEFVVNGLPAGQYFSTISNAAQKYMEPFKLLGKKGQHAVTVQVQGSGISAQLDAVVHGLSRAIVFFDPESRNLLKKAGFLTRDDRMKETRKVGMGGKARRKRQSPKR